jgi:hypothetical protein
MTDPTHLAHASLLAARRLVLAAGAATWTGPAAVRFRDRLAETSAGLTSLADAVEAIGPPSPAGPFGAAGLAATAMFPR